MTESDGQGCYLAAWPHVRDGRRVARRALWASAAGANGTEQFHLDPSIPVAAHPPPLDVPIALDVGFKTKRPQAVDYLVVVVGRLAVK